MAQEGGGLLCGLAEGAQGYQGVQKIIPVCSQTDTGILQTDYIHDNFHCKWGGGQYTLAND